MAQQAHKNPAQQPEGWDSIVDAYAPIAKQFIGQFSEAALQHSPIEPGSVALDVAAGTGEMSLRLARRGAKVLATDFAPGMLDYLQQKAQSQELAIETTLADGQDLHTIASGSCDVATSAFGLIFFPDLDAGFRELHRVLRPGGKAIVIGWGELNRFTFMGALMRAIKTHLPDFKPPGPPIWSRLAQPGAMEAHMAGAGFKEIEVHKETVDWEIDTRGDMQSLLATAPPLVYLFKSLGEKTSAAIANTLAEQLRAEHGEVAKLPADGLIAIGVR